MNPDVLSAGLPGLTAGLLGEVMLGVLIGFIARLLFAAVEMAGELIGFQMGFSMVNVVDPMRGIPVPIVGQFYGLLAMLIFLTLNAHYVFLQAIGSSFALIPPFRFGMSEPLGDLLISLVGEMFVLAVKISAPVVVAVFITNVALNIVSRTVPQMNILVVGFPVTLAVGLLMMAMSLGLTGQMMAGVFSGMEGRLAEMMGVMGR
ncbi:MAG: flagellar biosynthetic protein FliR [Nitrospirae bacterium]|nr:flagellar biosynthetic protein FliR [Nitrospirota bacterium]